MSDTKLCPDGGTCHHLCEASCFRVQTCEPLSNVYYKDEWPQQVVYEHTRDDYVLPLTAAQVLVLSSQMRMRGWSKTADKLEEQFRQNKERVE